MKPSSIVSLVVAVLLIVVGLTTCIIAQNMANANGETLFSEVKSDGLVTQEDLTGVDISKIELIVSDADINIIGKSRSSYIEFVNFRENYYTLTKSNKVLSFDEIPDVVSMLKFWENGFSFKGMRYIFNFKPETEGKKVVNVYIGSDMNIKIFNISADRCTLNLENLTSGSDYNIDIVSGEINATTLKTTSSFYVNGTNLKLNLNSAVLNNMEVKADHLEMTVGSFRVNGGADVECRSGVVDLVTPSAIDALPLDLDTIEGTIRINGKEVSSSYRQNESDSSNAALIKVTTETADISIRQNSATAETSAEETSGRETSSADK